MGQSLVVLRVVRGWSRQDLADAIGAPEGTLANWERGTARPRIAMLERLVDAMGFPPPLFGRTLAFVHSARDARDWHVTGGDRASSVQAADIAARAAQSLEGAARASVALLSSAAVRAPPFSRRQG